MFRLALILAAGAVAIATPALAIMPVQSTSQGVPPSQPSSSTGPASSDGTGSTSATVETGAVGPATGDSFGGQSSGQTGAKDQGVPTKGGGDHSAALARAYGKLRPADQAAITKAAQAAKNNPQCKDCRPK